MKLKLSLLLACIIFLVSNTRVVGQNIDSLDSLTIKASFDKLIKGSSTWETFKVVPIVKMQAFASELKDSIVSNKLQVEALKQKLVSQKIALDTANTKLKKLNSQLELSQTTNDQISFLGIGLTKAGYHAFVWVVICGLLVLITIVYMLYLRSNILTKQFKKDLDLVRDDLENQRSKSHESQVKLKRELQTLMNTMAEKGIKI
jgi:hypothetical protein